MKFTRDWPSLTVTVALVLALLTATGSPVAAAVVEERNERFTAVQTEETTATETSTGQNTTTSSNETTSTDESPNDSEPPQETDTPTATPVPSSTPDSHTTDEATFELSNLSAPSVVRRGDEFRVDATVTNTAGTNGTKLVNYTFGGSVVDTERVALDAGESTRVTFRSSLSEIEDRHGSAAPGPYVHGVRNETGGGAAARIRVTPDIDFTAQTFDAPTEISKDDPYVVLATVENPGNTTITRTVAYEFDGNEVAAKTVTVDAGKQRQVAFEISMADVESTVGSIDDATTHNHTVVTGESRRGGEVRVVEGPSADASMLAVERFQTPNDVRPGETVQVNMTVRNVGSSQFEGQLSYRLDDAIVATQWVRVPMGEERTVRFEASYADIERAAVPLSSRSTEHGIWAGDESVSTRPVTVHAAVETPTETPPPATFTSSPENGSPPSSQSSPSASSSECERGFFSYCGGASMDETTLTLVGIATSVLGIAYEMLKSR
ncbi:PH domain-containing protein [Haloprofundus halobius]|uniref:PH domain-containing protein n=1 Tax=Haloprofundus halobius TaxID=2876194 RepID=UPI001CCA3FC3|nr:PH domain-containing protein [Haloprofundus halobius]